MEDVIQAVERQLIEKELTENKFVRKTNFAKNEIYIISHQDSPNTMREIGRLRELTFRRAGGGTGKALDIDDFDTGENPYKQLIVWCPEDKEIVGGYRFINCSMAKPAKDGEYNLATSRLFEFSDTFINEYLPYTIELGRSFVQVLYQPQVDSRKGIFSLDNLWDGLGAIVVDNPEIRYFFGKITMYPKFNYKARDIILYFLHKYFPDNESLCYPRKPLKIHTDISELEQKFKGNNYEQDYKILIQAVKNLNESIPPLVNAYMNLSSTMRTFGTAINHSFGDVEETGILVNIGDIYDMKKNRHVATYKKSQEK
jgi:hypothetical protein